MKSSIAVLALLCLQISSSAQHASPHGSLHIGDTVPDIIISGLKNHPSSTAHLSDFRGKVVLIDFWASWCGSCIEGFAKMDAIQQRFPDKVQVLLIDAQQTGDNEEKTQALFTRYNKKTGYTPSLPYTVGDTILQRLFPHKILPQMVWIDDQGIYRASTEGTGVVADQVQALIDHQPLTVHQKRDSMTFDRGIPLFEASNSGLIKYRSTITKYIEGPGGLSGLLTGDSLSSKYIIYNYPLGYLYTLAFPKQLDLKKNQMIFNLPVGCAFKDDYFDVFNLSNKYCYELIVPWKLSEDRAMQIMRQELERTFNVTASAVRRKTKVLVIKANSAFQKNISKGGYTVYKFFPEDSLQYFHNMEASVLTNIFNELSAYPIIDSTGVNYNIDFSFPRNIFHLDQAALERLIKRAGFTIRKEERVMPFAIFHEPSSIIQNQTAAK